MKTISRSKRSAFTLLEIMLVVAIIALLLGAGFAYLGPIIDVGKSTRLSADFRSFDTALQTYASLNGRPPTTEQGLQALVARPESDPQPQRWYQLMSQLPKDPWGADYVYVCPGKHNTSSYDIYSKGPDGIADTADDKGNWQAEFK